MPDTVGPEQCEPTSLRAIATGGRWTVRLAEASATEEPDAGILHVRVCAGGCPYGQFLPRRPHSEMSASWKATVT